MSEKSEPGKFEKYMRYHHGWCNGAGCQPMHPLHPSDANPLLASLYKEGFRDGQKCRRLAMDAKATEMEVDLHPIMPQQHQPPTV